jgi:DNA-directed RNA polymerase subunit RPC12/RpoP
LSDPSSFTWRLRIKCTRCGAENEKDIFIAENDAVDQEHGHGTTHLNFKCRNCERKSQLDILPGTYQPWTASAAEKKNGFVQMIQFDCR